jgi:hypothetical protein
VWYGEERGVDEVGGGVDEVFGCVRVSSGCIIWEGLVCIQDILI